MSFPPGTEMFQFSGFASPKPILFSLVIPLPFNYALGKPRTELNGEGGLSHSEIAGSKPAHGSPTLIAACHVLHRLYVPRHPRIALTSRLRVHTTNDNAGSSLRTTRNSAEQRRLVLIWPDVDTHEACRRAAQLVWMIIISARLSDMRLHRTLAHPACLAIHK